VLTTATGEKHAPNETGARPIVGLVITYVTGDATRPIGVGPRVVVHVCNDVGAWGAGFVVALSRRWREPETAYKSWYRSRKRSVEPPFQLGSVQFVDVADQLWVANMIGQRDIKRSRNGEAPVRYNAIATCLGHVAEFAEVNQATVHMPRIGSGLAGGDWNRIESIIDATLGAVDVTVYDLPEE
jgi:O-acetyl-ADP-ribose deacetylase (regulator of RNase III)